MMGRMLHTLQVPLLHGCYNESGRRLLDSSGLPGTQECHSMANSYHTFPHCSASGIRILQITVIFASSISLLDGFTL